MHWKRFTIACAILLLASGPAVAAGDMSLEALKRMIEQSAALTAAPGSSTPPAQLTQRVPLSDFAGLTPTHRVLLDVRSNHSDGQHDMDTLAQLAEKRGIDVLAFGEHDRYTIRFGLDPIAPWLGVWQEHPSLYSTGLPEFFADLERTRRNHPSLTIMAATESTPGYYWSGIPFFDLALHDAEQHIIALGVENPTQIEALPSYDLRHIRGSREFSLVIWFLVVISLSLLLLRRRSRGVALLLTLSLIALVATWLMKEGGDADADFIEQARQQKLFTIWAHPGTQSGVRDGPFGVRLDTPPYSARLFAEPTADAFAAVYGDSDNNTLPGGKWDRFMMDYQRGYHSRPLRAVAAGDYHGEGEAGEYLGNFPMDVWSNGDDGASILEALKRGHNNSWFMQRQLNLTMPALFLVDSKGQRLLPGDEAKVSGEIRAVAALKERLPEEEKASAAADDRSSDALTPDILTLKGEWIVDGHVAAPVELVADGMACITQLALEPGPHVVRLRIPVQKGVRMEANPFLVRVGG